MTWPLSCFNTLYGIVPASQLSGRARALFIDDGRQQAQRPTQTQTQTQTQTTNNKQQSARSSCFSPELGALQDVRGVADAGGQDERLEAVRAVDLNDVADQLFFCCLGGGEGVECFGFETGGLIKW